jgi:hypothetical protein
MPKLKYIATIENDPRKLKDWLDFCDVNEIALQTFVTSTNEETPKVTKSPRKTSILQTNRLKILEDVFGNIHFDTDDAERAFASAGDPIKYTSQLLADYTKEGLLERVSLGTYRLVLRRRGEPSSSPRRPIGSENRISKEEAHRLVPTLFTPGLPFWPRDLKRECEKIGYLAKNIGHLVVDLVEDQTIEKRSDGMYVIISADPKTNGSVYRGPNPTTEEVNEAARRFSEGVDK